jgi:tetratricopeptide (TPR) repeat protein
MPRWDKPSNVDLVYEVLMSARQPLTFQEVFDEVNRRRPVTTRHPKATIRNALAQGRQLVSIGEGRYGYLPHMLVGSLLRLPLQEENPANHPLIYLDEVRHALWPSFSENRKRSVREPVQVRLPNGDGVALCLTFLSRGVWGTPMPEGLRRYLVENRAASGDSLLIRVGEGETGRFETWFEPHWKRDGAAEAKRNRELADAAHGILRRNPAHEVPIWDLIIAMLARGLYRSDVPPDPLEAVLRADPRFVHAGLQMWILAEGVTPEVQSIIRRRRRFDAEPYQAEEETPAGLGEVTPPLDIRRSVEGGDASPGDTFAKGVVPRRRAATPAEKAQDLMYEAWEASDPQERARMAWKALHISHDCSDAYVMLAEETALGPNEAAELYAKGVASGERALGQEAFEEGVGCFWGLIESRPYMRARSGLAQALWTTGKRQEAIAHVWDMLRLNPNDNQGVRYLLLNWLLEIGDGAQVKKLLDPYPGDPSAVWLYGRALHAFQTEGDTRRARKLRAEAERKNPYVPAYLLGRKRLPSRLPETMGFGDESEAVVCAAEQMAVWRQTPGALAWLDKGAG